MLIILWLPLISVQPLLFGAFYFVYKHITPRSLSVDIRNLTPSHYVLGDLEDLEEENPNNAPRKSSDASNQIPDPEPGTIELESPRQSRLGFGESSKGKAPVNDNVEESDLSPEMQDEIEAQRARREERERVRAILETRPMRMERGFWRELWSFVIAD